MFDGALSWLGLKDADFSSVFCIIVLEAAADELKYSRFPFYSSPNRELASLARSR
jgi:hypothetical protein